MIKEEIQKLKRIVKELRSNASEIGDEGDMTCVARTPDIAARKFVKYVKYVCSDMDGNDLREKIKDGSVLITGGYLHLVTDKDREENSEFEEDTEWYVSELEKSNYPVFIIRI